LPNILALFLANVSSSKSVFMPRVWSQQAGEGNHTSLSKNYNFLG